MPRCIPEHTLAPFAQKVSEVSNGRMCVAGNAFWRENTSSSILCVRIVVCAVPIICIYTTIATLRRCGLARQARQPHWVGFPQIMNQSSFTLLSGGGVKRSPAGLPRQSSDEPSLDPKYFPHPSSLPEPTQAPPILTSVTPGVLRPPSGGRGGRGGRGRGGRRVTEQQIPLTSAYFPNS